MSFSTELNLENNWARLALSGRVDSVTARDLDVALDELSQADRAIKLVDFSGLSYIGSGGFRSLLAVAKREEGHSRLILCGLSAEIESLFDLCGFLDLFEIVPDTAGIAA